MKLGKADKAFEEIQHATTLDSNYATAWQYRGELEMEQTKLHGSSRIAFSRPFAGSNNNGVGETRGLLPHTRLVDQGR